MVYCCGSLRAVLLYPTAEEARQNRAGGDVIWVARVVACASLGLVLVPAFFVFAGLIAWETHATLALFGTVLWFSAALWTM